MASFAAMNRTDAERLASTVVDGVTVNETRAIIDEFLRQIARCPVCGDTGRFTFDQPTTVEQPDPGHPSGSSPLDVVKGYTTDCPRCGPPDEGKGRGDPAFVRWCCASDKDGSTCRKAKTAGLDEHRDCGPRIVLPIPA